MELIVDTELPAVASWALGELSRVLEARGEATPGVSRAGNGPGLAIGIVGQSPTVDEALVGAGASCPEAPESLVLLRSASDRVVVAGRDEAGLTYAVLEAARAVELASSTVPALDAITPAVESPHLPWRSLQLFLCNRTLEAEWFYDEAFWDEYLTRLAYARYNNLSLTLAHQIAYLAPPYPFLVDVPGFPQVRARDFSDAERDRHLEMFQRIAAMTRQRGLHFTFGVWSQHAHRYGESLVEGLTDDILSSYNAAGLATVLAACPQIDGVQFRMNVESGVDEEHQAEFYEPQFRAVAECGRPLRLDLRAKGLADATIELAQSLVPDTVISTKHWCEHLGLPYAMPAVQQFDRDRASGYRRYGTWDLLRKPRSFRLIHRLWSAGSQRVLLWGDPEWVRRFALSCADTGDGFEIMAPLTNKGARDARPPWLTVGDDDVNNHADEHRRYWMYYLLFGRLGYAPGCAPEVWQRELRHRCASSAGAVETVYRAGSQILPLLTAALQHSASLWRFWPERYAGRSLDEDVQIEPSDPTQLYRVDEYVEEALQDRLTGKWTPPHVADHLRRLARRTHEAVAELEPAEDMAEIRATGLDFTLLAHLAEYHACRLLATTHVALFRRTGESGRLLAARQLLSQARGEWSALAQVAAGRYADDLVFGFRDNGHCGHWKDDLGVVEQDLACVEELLAADEGSEAGVPAFAGGDSHPGPPKVLFEPPMEVAAQRDLTLHLDLEPGTTLSVARCHHRIQNQALDFDSVDMVPDGDRWSATIPAESIDPAWDLVVFFELEWAGGSSRWPDWRRQTPYFLIATAKG